MTQLQAHEIAMAFNTLNDKKSWTARANSRPSSGTDMVHFTSTSGLVALSYNALDGRFTVKFNKFTAAWGDYIAAISRSLYTVLNTLKAAGLSFEAPPTPEGIEIIATRGADNSVYVRWNPPQRQPLGLESITQNYAAKSQPDFQTNTAADWPDGIFMPQGEPDGSDVDNSVIPHTPV